MPVEVNRKGGSILIWADLTAEHLIRLEQCHSAEEKTSAIADIFDLKSFDDDLKSEIVVDLYFYALQFAEEMKFSREQTSAFFSIVKATHHKCIETPFDNMQATFDFFKELVLCHSVRRPPYSVGLFNPDQVQKVMDYVLRTYFKHFKMYKFAFTPKVRLDLSFKYIGIPETPLPESEAVEDKDGEQAVEEPDAEGPESPQRSGSAGERLPSEGENDDDMPEGMHELRSLVELTVTEQIQQLRLAVDEKIKTQDKKLAEKLSAVEGASALSGKAPGKQKKK
ncbi:cilia- and flagella-associated protein 119-like [Oscarella lobularis]|uniref:cilia- and flagella-associated protein 119-like n=1 Tax=Oscarella lobularis TaxID=121494 RepID=UPI003313A860